ncbi:MAG: alpha-mannosidase [Egibacteraceae bacterium]
MTTTLHLVPHTHWDREWYLPFQRFRLRLVELMDGLLDLLERDPDFRFTMDGQLAAVDDYLQIRPENTERVRKLAAEGRLTIGPWTVLLDEFLVSGETIVRNLAAGCRRGAELGPVMDVGYLPDMFGHVAQMPQILRRAGFGDAVLWRGVPARIDRHAFAWSAPDGSTVRAEYLLGGYGQGVELLDIPDRVAARIAAYHDGRRAFAGEEHVLAMFGGDHVMPRPETSELVARANADQDRYRVRIATIAEYLDTVRDLDDQLPSWSGELRSGARANLLMGVASLRLPLRQAAARAERGLERYAEPLQALYGGDWPVRLLDVAWGNVIVNSAHDSICGCSLDEVDAQVRVRYAEAEQIAAGMADTVVQRVAADVVRGSSVVFNPSPLPRAALVELDHVVPESFQDVAVELGDGTRVAAQAAAVGAPVLYDEVLAGRDAAEAVFGRMHARELLGRLLNGYHAGDVGGQPTLTFDVDFEPDPILLDLDQLRAEVARRLAADPDADWRVRVIGRPRRSVAAVVSAPPLGFATARPVEGHGTLEHPVTVSAAGLDNGLVSVTAADDGTLTLTGDGVALTGVGRLVDGGDAGDSYNYAPPPADVLVEQPSEIDVRVAETGPVRGALVVHRAYRWPAGLADDAAGRTDETVACTVITRVEVRAGEPFARLRVALRNPVPDHRLRFHVPLPGRVERSFAEGQFAVVERGLEAEGGHGEHPLPTYPAHGFVAVDGVAALLNHVTEYEIVADGTELALTVLRATGMISRNANPYRSDPAGPQVAIPGAQLLEPCALEFALHPHRGAWHQAGVVEAAEAYRLPFMVERGSGETTAELPGPGLALHGEGVVLSALHHRDGWLEARVICERPTPVRGRLEGGVVKAREADLLGTPGAALDVTAGGVDLDLGPFQIRTLQLRRGR